MVFEAEILAIVIGLMGLANAIVAALVTPLFDKFEWDKFPIMYIAWAVAGLFVALSGVNLFANVFPSPIVGQVITAIVAGRGANLIHDVSDK
jgi:hypothetical protein